MPAKKANPTTKTTKPSVPSQPAVNKTNTVSIFAIILTFLLFTIPVIGLILGIVALVQIKKRNEGGKGLAIASIVFSSIFIIVQLVFLGFVVWLMSVGNNISSGRQSLTFNVNGNTVALGALPNGFPADVSIYPGSKIFLAGKSNNNEYAVTLSTTDSKEKVKNYYKTQMTANGWTESQPQATTQDENGMSMMNDQSSALKFTKDTRTTNVEVVENNKGTQIVITVAPTTSVQNETN